MIETIRLHPSEYDLLKNFEDGFCPDPDRSVAIVARNDERIIGRTFLIPLVHVEGTFVAKPWRNGPVLKQLMAALEVEARAEGLKTLMSYSPNALVDDYLARLGYTKSKLTLWGKEL